MKIEYNQVTSDYSFHYQLDSIDNSDWILIEGYYYSISVDYDSLDKKIPNDISLINPNLTASEISNENLTEEQYIPQFEVIYGFVENYVGTDGKVSAEDAWCVTFNNDVPQKINNGSLNS